MVMVSSLVTGFGAFLKAGRCVVAIIATMTPRIQAAVLRTAYRQGKERTFSREGPSGSQHQQVKRP